MKKLLVILFFAAIAQTDFAQSSDFTFGIKYGWMHPDNINRTVYTYNYTRQWLSQKMDYFKLMKGWEASWQFRGKSMGLECIMDNMHATNIANGVEPTGGSIGYRKIKVGMGGISFGASGYFMKSKHLEIVPSFDFDFNFFGVHDWYANNSNFTNGQETTDTEKFKMGNTFAINFSLFATKWLGINIRPYYCLPWGKVNSEGLMYNLQGDQNVQRESIRNYGVSASLIIGIGRDY